mgnify:CR=1 FL=1
MGEEAEGRLSCKKLLHMLEQKLQTAANDLKIAFGIVDNFLKGQLFWNRYPLITRGGLSLDEAAQNRAK